MFEQKYEKCLSFLSENFQFLEVKFSTCLHRRVFVMRKPILWILIRSALSSTTAQVFMEYLELCKPWHFTIKNIENLLIKYIKRKRFMQ